MTSLTQSLSKTTSSKVTNCDHEVRTRTMRRGINMIRQDDKQLQGGDKVLWRGGFGTHQPQVATVMDMAITEGPRPKYGASVIAVDWTVVRANRAVFDLDNGH